MPPSSVSGVWGGGVDQCPRLVSVECGGGC